MKNNNLSNKRKKEIDEMYEKRAVLLMANGKVRCNNDLDMYVFLSNYTNINFKMFDICYIKFELVQKSIYDDYLVKIWIDEDRIFHAEDAVPGKNWFEEVRNRKREKLFAAFGYCDDKMVDEFMGG